jgi:ABC-type nitrate/sulfonate/bicarbonate transport system ATPase subunit
VGKTTLFRIIAGLLSPTSGHVQINGNQNVKVGDIGVVAQTYPLFENRTVESNLMIAARQKEKDDKQATAKITGYMSAFDLWDRRHAYPAELSGGQRQRTSILQQVLCSEHFLLMDEPFSGLDMLMVEKTSKLIQAVADMDELNTIIICTHDIPAAAAVSDHLWLMGRDRDKDDKPIPGARIMETYDLAQRDLCWHPNILTEPKFADFVREIRERFRTL